MSHPPCIALLICSLTIVVAASFLPFLNSGFRPRHRAGFPTWTVVLALIATAASLARLMRIQLNQNQIIDAIGLTVAMLAGLCLKWLLETVAQKKLTIHEGVFFRALLAAPLALALLPGAFGIPPSPAIVLLWFFNGFFWHTLFSDIERLFAKERAVIRRREPPTLPHDFRKPEVD